MDGLPLQCDGSSRTLNTREGRVQAEIWQLELAFRSARWKQAKAFAL
jgi:hypothetical protein